MKVFTYKRGEEQKGISYEYEPEDSELMRNECDGWELVKVREEVGKPKCKLTGTDGNVFALAGKVGQVLKKAGQPEKAKEFTTRLFQCGSYGEALTLMQKYVEVI